MRITANSLLVVLVSLFLFSCTEEKVPKAFHPRNDHEAYEHLLEQAKITQTALGTEWKRSAEESLSKPVKISTPYEEAFFLDPNQADALGYQFAAKRGQKIKIKINTALIEDSQLFMDLYRVEASGTQRHVATASKAELLLGFEPRKDAEYILRFQPELLRGGKFTVTIENVPTLSFPVAGKTASAIQSVWGDVRDGGKRSHEGVDIFARRGTPVLAPTKGYIRFVGKRGIGGNVVWLYDSERGQSLYFAHLNTLIAKKGTYVEPGDTLGTVGNTGNARTTPPHLHFGVYKNGAVNPFHYLQAPPENVKSVKGSLNLLGEYVRLTRKSLLKENMNDKKYTATLSSNEVMKVLAMNSNSYRVELFNGQTGYIQKSRLTAASRPIELLNVRSEIDILQKPELAAFGQFMDKGEQLAVLGKHNGFWMVKNKLGETGWITDRDKNTRRRFSADPD
jgi:peptidoglycan LD-endopeptidase LytH